MCTQNSPASMTVSYTGIGITIDSHLLKYVMQQAAVSQDREPLNNISTHALSVDRDTTEMKSSTRTDTTL